VITLNLSSLRTGVGAEGLLPESFELGWCSAYLRALAQEEPLPQAMPPQQPFAVLPVHETPPTVVTPRDPKAGPQRAGSRGQGAPAPHFPAETEVPQPLPPLDAPRSPARAAQAVEVLMPRGPQPAASSRVGTPDPATPLPAEPQQARPPLLTLPAQEAPPPAAVPSAPSVTAQRVAAQLAQVPVPPSRVWQVELPAAQPGWQLRVEQLQPQAPLRLDLSVPLALQPHARRQLAELDKRLREAGHDVLGARLGDAPRMRQQRVDEVQP
jgi:hypothetical protein